MATRLYKQHVHHLFSLSIFLYLPILTLHLYSFSVELFFFFLIQLLLSLCLLLSLLSSSFCPTIFATLCLPLCPLCLNLQHFFLLILISWRSLTSSFTRCWSSSKPPPSTSPSTPPTKPCSPSWCQTTWESPSALEGEVRRLAFELALKIWSFKLLRSCLVQF